MKRFVALPFAVAFCMLAECSGASDDSVLHPVGVDLTIDVGHGVIDDFVLKLI